MTKTEAAVVMAAMAWFDKQDVYLRAETNYPMRQLLAIYGSLVLLKRACAAYAKEAKKGRK